MRSYKLMHIVFTLSLLLVFIPFACGWGFDGHIAVCRIAQARLSEKAANGVKKLVGNDLGKLCPWADRIKLIYRWSSDLHFIDTPDDCTYNYNRDCKGRDGVIGRCVAGAINNYTNQLLTYRNIKPQHNLSEALLFLSHFVGDIHQPLHVGFKSNKGGNTINVTWFNRKEVLHYVWDTDIIKRALTRFNNSNVNQFVKEIQQKIRNKWANQVNIWEACGGNRKTCPNIYAAESIKEACQWAYKGVQNGSILKDNYYNTRLPIVELRLAQAGIRLAATLNRIFT